MAILTDVEVIHDINHLITQAKEHLYRGELRETITKLEQAEILQDSLIVYRLNRSPERKVFEIQTGDMK